MADEENKVEEVENPDEWEYEYEYVEVPEGEEGEGYEYVEIPEDEAGTDEIAVVQEVDDLGIDIGEPVSLDDSFDTPSIEKITVPEEIEVIEIDDTPSDIEVVEIDDTPSDIEVDEIKVEELNDNQEASEIEVEEISVEDFPMVDEIEVEEIHGIDKNIPQDVQVEEIDMDDFISQSDEVIEIPYDDEEPIEIPYDNVVEEVLETPIIAEAAKIEEPIVENIVVPTLENHTTNELENLNAKITDLTEDDYQYTLENAKIFTKENDIDVFQATNIKNSIFIGDIDFASSELDRWKLIIFDKNIINISDANNFVKVPLLDKAVRYAKLIKNGQEKVAFFNDVEFTIAPKDNEFGLHNGKFIFGNVENDSNLQINDFINISVGSYKGKKITFTNPVSGMLVGPSAAILYFADVKSIIVPNSSNKKTDPLYDYDISSNAMNEGLVRLTGASEAKEIIGSNISQGIHIDVGASTYGWNVSFDNGIAMSIKDVIIFQRKNGSLPSSNGTISYGSKKFNFKNIKKIVMYETPQYISYGK